MIFIVETTPLLIPPLITESTRSWKNGTVFVQKKKWDEEDESDEDVKDNWDDSEEESEASEEESGYEVLPPPPKAPQPAKNPEPEEALSSMNPRTEAEFNDFRKALVDKILKSQNQRNFSNFVNQIVRDLCDPLNDVDVSRVNRTISALLSEKQRAAKNASKNKKKGGAKKAVVTAPPKGKLDTEDYTNGYDDFDDFM
ncbi:hypothetical protein BB559_003254 [Furculomyces boomerangus]|uniref:Eukaryotic translation initiation factor 3 30 kDa subunit n=2 Tax=Harpellales TaxID=61421 RepID=A0A2T9YMA5_9FUNG|nr:hypothetical protein BB559_003254 [Furculomyces boomerangus]PVZ99796.1 hypothetical protein BB558_004177 [Smittium angustum]